MKKLTYRKIQSFQAIITVLVIFASFYLEYAVGLQPCPLCLMQRVCVFILLGLMGLSLGTVKKAHIVSLMQFLVACAGLYFSLRQLWLQSLPSDQAPACMPGLDVLIQYFPWQTVAKALFWGAGDCAEVTWIMFGISMPGWAAMYFLFMAIMGLFLFFRTRTIN
ncbi:TPA: disulfide bond formation protein B [Legionella pneumophila subsp. pneumophila]|uniref:disulfide bond formation protein B n=1 Tax=Legionella pneumophila TaxID=446 RepID=UPI000770952B|nr:disulfide bond formation protein B [Legionella pneumophila]HAT9214145.1 disulfide bond formation protein B [Legionella pneumophila subsp. pneumophila]CZI73372.1 Disulfide oxidoreductase [Legionella pneumophila]HAT9261020.1 disulfide bond formation protein B [Legionella pneumophila subsp. pneumophila]HAT9282103.1 disulfide bond formation protein B [Legionella pneumophila subsp. pneumophila]HAT9287879.1 disulfide bond formation protein B [Legionella pneumophila subsp. pneumophila]